MGNGDFQRLSGKFRVIIKWLVPCKKGEPNLCLISCCLRKTQIKLCGHLCDRKITSGGFPYKVWDYQLSFYVTMKDLSPITIKHVPVTLPWLGTTQTNFTVLLGWNKDCFGLCSWSLWSFLYWPMTSQTIEKIMPWD